MSWLPGSEDPSLHPALFSAFRRGPCYSWPSPPDIAPRSDRDCYSRGLRRPGCTRDTRRPTATEMRSHQQMRRIVVETAILGAVMVPLNGQAPAGQAPQVFRSAVDL